MSGTFHGLQIVHGQLQNLAPPEHPHCVPLIIVQILTRKNSLWTFACRTVQRAVNTQAGMEDTYMTDRLRDREEEEEEEIKGRIERMSRVV